MNNTPRLQERVLFSMSSSKFPYAATSFSSFSQPPVQASVAISHPARGSTLLHEENVQLPAGAPHTSLCISFSWPCLCRESPSGALWDPCTLCPRVTLQRLPGGTWPYLLCPFVCGITGAAPPHPPLPAAAQNQHQINLTGIKTCYRAAFPQGMQENPSGQENLKAFSSLSPAFPNSLSQPWEAVCFLGCLQAKEGLSQVPFCSFRGNSYSPKPEIL